MPKALTWVGFKVHWKVTQTDIGVRNGYECKIDAYTDADFVGMFGHEKPVDP